MFLIKSLINGIDFLWKKNSKPNKRANHVNVMGCTCSHVRYFIKCGIKNISIN